MSSLEQQLKMIETGTGLYELQSRFLQVKGADAASFLHRIVSQNIQTQTVGEFRHAALLDRKGMLLSLFGLIKLKEGDFLLILQESLFQKTLDHLKKFRLMDKVEFVDRSGEYTFFYIVSTNSPSPPLNLRGGYFFWNDSIYKKLVTGYLVPSKETDAFRKVAPPISKTVFDLLRMESGIPEYGVDIDERFIVLEGNLHFAVARQKGCYPGQEVVERIYAYGKGRTPKSLCPLEWNEEVVIEPGSPILNSEGKQVGTITSSLWHPLKKKLLILAYLESKYLEPTPHLKKRIDSYFIES